MREIKFRAWDKLHKRLADVVSIDFISGEAILDDSEDVWRVGFGDIVMEQYTGLKDKNGKEIYENDIVHFNANGLSGLGIVFWEQSTCQFAIKDIRRGRTDRTYPFWKDQKYVVKSNIHENADLLEVPK